MLNQKETCVEMGRGQKNIESKKEQAIETFKDIKLSKNREKTLIVNKCHGIKKVSEII